MRSKFKERFFILRQYRPYLTPHRLVTFTHHSSGQLVPEDDVIDHAHFRFLRYEAQVIFVPNFS